MRVLRKPMPQAKPQAPIDVEWEPVETARAPSTAPRRPSPRSRSVDGRGLLAALVVDSLVDGKLSASTARRCVSVGVDLATDVLRGLGQSPRRGPEGPKPQTMPRKPPIRVRMRP